VLAAAMLVSGALHAGDGRLLAQGAAAPSLLPPGEAGTPLYVYQTDARGIYSSEVNDDNTKPRLKARFQTGADGAFAFRTIMPGQYPRSGPPAHIHLEVTPAGRPVERFELVFEGDSRLTDAIKADARAGRFYALCAPTTATGGGKQCTGVTFRVR